MTCPNCGAPSGDMRLVEHRAHGLPDGMRDELEYLYSTWQVHCSRCSWHGDTYPTRDEALEVLLPWAERMTERIGSSACPRDIGRHLADAYPDGPDHLVVMLEGVDYDELQHLQRSLLGLVDGELVDEELTVNVSFIIRPEDG